MNADSATRLRLRDLGVLDARELQGLLPPGSFEVEEQPLRPGEHGDLGITTAMVVLLAPPVILAITAWLLKKRQRRSVVLTVEKIGPDKTIERRSLEINFSGSEAPQAEVLEQLASGLKLDPELVKAVTGASK